MARPPLPAVLLALGSALSGAAMAHRAGTTFELCADGRPVTVTLRHVPEGFAVAGHETRLLARGGDHVMLLGLTPALKDGDTITLVLTFEREGEMTLDVPVDNARKAPDDAATHRHSP
ncbi:MAG: copper chaperone PCu(A)C [Gemmobacter sp.]